MLKFKTGSKIHEIEKQLRSKLGHEYGIVSAVKKPIIMSVVFLPGAFEVDLGTQTVKGNPGDLLMVSPSGDVYPCSRKVFDETYTLYKQETSK